MNSITRWISLVGRRGDSEKDRLRVLRLFAQWQGQVASLAPAARTAGNATGIASTAHSVAPLARSKKLLLIRLDDIGDYLVFRNQLATYKRSDRWREHRVTLLGNASWRELFEVLDVESVDDVIWVEKNKYLQVSEYRESIWRELRARGFDSAVATSCARPLLLDDLCVLAAAPVQRIGNANIEVHPDWNRLSDALYTELFHPPATLMHDFLFNAAFTQWVCGISDRNVRPNIEWRPAIASGRKYILCFVGASIRSKRWPAQRWVEFIKKLRKVDQCDIVVAGHGLAEMQIAQIIANAVPVDNIVNQSTQTELLGWVANAAAVISNDTMAAHLGVSFDVPTVIIANGVNYMRFAEYEGAGIANVRALYPKAVQQKRKRYGNTTYAYREAVTADIASISAREVLDALRQISSF